MQQRNYYGSVDFEVGSYWLLGDPKPCSLSDSALPQNQPTKKKKECEPTTIKGNITLTTQSIINTQHSCSYIFAATNIITAFNN